MTIYKVTAPSSSGSFHPTNPNPYPSRPVAHSKVPSRLLPVGSLSTCTWWSSPSVKRRDLAPFGLPCRPPPLYRSSTMKEGKKGGWTERDNSVYHLVEQDGWRTHTLSKTVHRESYQNVRVWVVLTYARKQFCAQIAAFRNQFKLCQRTLYLGEGLGLGIPLVLALVLLASVCMHHKAWTMKLKNV